MRSLNRNSCLNLLKCIACFGVVFIHVTFPGKLGDIVKYASAFAVPIFILIAGYYSFGCSESKIKNRLIKIIKILLFGYVWFLLVQLLVNMKNNQLSSWIISNFNWKTPIWYIVFCTISWAVPLWYLIAMAETYFFWKIIVKHNLQDQACKWTWVLLLAGALLTTLVDSFNLNWSYKINFVCRALPWFMLGYLIRGKYEDAIKRLSNQKWMLLAVIGWIITLSAVLLKTKVNYNYWGVLLTAPSLFAIGIKNPNLKVSKAIEFIGDKLSLFIYIFHPLVSQCILALVGKLEFCQKNVDIYKYIYIYIYIHPIITLIATIIIANIFYIVFKNEKLKRLIY